MIADVFCHIPITTLQGFNAEKSIRYSMVKRQGLEYIHISCHVFFYLKKNRIVIKS